ncbi:MAG: 50S ribosomal protein L18e [Archaeoglobaceae archaeon]|nr:50S ribosomal protein L18e [Archaeoglobaceae archaeon]MDW7989128.1 50S ribosomal protein L18e [Archaeoglobaceae archaeon]
MGKIRKLQKRKTNPRLINLIDLLLNESAKNNAKIWKILAEKLASPARSWAEVNLTKIEKCAKEGETIVVPGKVLGGDINKPIKVAAFSFSESAKAKIVEVGGQWMKIEELIKINPKGIGLKILV